MDALCKRRVPAFRAEIKSCVIRKVRPYPLQTYSHIKPEQHLFI